MKNERKMTQIDHCTFGPASKTSPAQLFPARAAAPRPQPGPGLAKPRRCARPPGLRSARSFAAVRSDRRLARAFREVKTPPQPVHSQTLESFRRSLLSLLRSLFSAEHNRVSDESESASERTVERGKAPSPAPSLARVLPNG